MQIVFRRTALFWICANLMWLPLLFLTGQGQAAFVDPVDPGLVSETVTYASGAQEITAYLSRPKKEGRHPAVIVIHGNSGTSPYHQDVARRLAKEGYAAIAPDLISRAGGTGKFAARGEAERALRQIKRKIFTRIWIPLFSTWRSSMLFERTGSVS